MQEKKKNSMREFSALADSLQYEYRVENEDIIRRLRTFYESVLSKMDESHIRYNAVSRLHDSLGSSKYFDIYYELPEDQRQHILNYANSWAIFLPKARPVTAIAVQRLHELFVRDNAEAVQLIQKYQQIAIKSKDEEAIKLIGKLADKNICEISLRVSEDIANILYYDFKVENVPYLKTEDKNALKSSTTPKDFISDNEMIRPGNTIEPLRKYSGDNVYLALIRVYNHLSSTQNQNDFNLIVEVLSLQGENAKKAVLPLAVIAANAPEGKWILKSAIKYPNKSPFGPGIALLLDSDILEEEDGKVRLKIKFNITPNAALPNISATTSPEKKETWEGRRCPE